MWVDAAMLVKPAILDRHGALLEPRGDLIALDWLAVFVVGEHAKARAVIGIDGAVRANFACLDGAQRREVTKVPCGAKQQEPCNQR